MTNSARSKQDWQLTKCSIKERFRELLHLAQWTDCTFAVGEENPEIIHCHKLVLAASSPVFEALFFGGLSCPTEEIISVPDIDPYIFKLFLAYIYSDTLELSNVEDAGGLLYAAKKYLMPQLGRVCLGYLTEATSIKTLWDILIIAEALNEEELLNVCLKVMSRYPYDIWSSETDHLSGNTLAMLFDQKQMNMNEPELWKLLTKWSIKECQLKELQPTPENLRGVLESVGVLRKIRFLLFSPQEFNELVRKSNILTDDECNLFDKLIVLKTADKNTDLISCGFNLDSNHRLKVSPITWRCTRELVTGDRVLTYSGPAQTKMSSSSKVLITGFEVVTRICSVSYQTGGAFSTGNSYRERLRAVIKDESGNMLTEINHDSLAEFNSNQTVSLSTPIWFDEGVRYTILFLFPTGIYPLCYLADTAMAKGTVFEFDDSLEKDNFKTKGSFITSVLYSI